MTARLSFSSSLVLLIDTRINRRFKFVAMRASGGIGDRGGAFGPFGAAAGCCCLTAVGILSIIGRVDTIGCGGAAAGCCCRTDVGTVSPILIGRGRFVLFVRST